VGGILIGLRRDLFAFRLLKTCERSHHQQLVVTKLAALSLHCSAVCSSFFFSFHYLKMKSRSLSHTGVQLYGYMKNSEFVCFSDSAIANSGQF
jgi:hypothetical protein